MSRTPTKASPLAIFTLVFMAITFALFTRILQGHGGLLQGLFAVCAYYATVLLLILQHICGESVTKMVRRVIPASLTASWAICWKVEVDYAHRIDFVLITSTAALALYVLAHLIGKE